MLNRKIAEERIKDFVKICMNRKLYFKKVFLFGSIVQEKNRKYSDIDVALVSDQFTGNPIKDLQFIIPVLSSSPKFTLFEPHLYTPLDFKEDPFADVIKKTGTEIDIKNNLIELPSGQN